MSVLLPAIAYGLMGGILLLLLAMIFVRALAGGTRSWPDKFKLRQKQRLVEMLDGFIGAGEWAKALAYVKNGFYLEPLYSSGELIERISNHNLGLLSRLVIISEKQSRSLSNLPVIEDLLLSRRDMLRAFLEALSAKAALGKKRRREIPAWALQEYKKKIDELWDRLLTNQKSLESQISQAISELSKQAASSEITYH